MATEFVGTNTEKVDKLVGLLIELRTTVRLCLAAVGLGMPLAVGLLTFLVTQSFGTAARAEQFGIRLDRVGQEVEQFGSRLDRVEQKLDRLVEQFDRLIQKNGKQ